jgi:hypothetical protein
MEHETDKLNEINKMEQEKDIAVKFNTTVITKDAVYYKKNSYKLPVNILKTIDKDYYEELEE